MSEKDEYLTHELAGIQHNETCTCNPITPREWSDNLGCICGEECGCSQESPKSLAQSVA